MLGHHMALIENSAGTGGTMGRSIEEIAQLVDRLGAHPASVSASIPAACGRPAST